MFKIFSVFMEYNTCDENFVKNKEYNRYLLKLVCFFIMEAQTSRLIVKIFFKPLVKPAEPVIGVFCDPA
jgi:hypothetical protein